MPVAYSVNFVETPGNIVTWTVSATLFGKTFSANGQYSTDGKTSTEIAATEAALKEALRQQVKDDFTAFFEAAVASL